jgi:DNA-binding NtrC family response regulator
MSVSIFQEAVSLKELVRAVASQAERNAILVALQRNQWCRKRTAKNLQISVAALVYKMREHGLLDNESDEITPT